MSALRKSEEDVVRLHSEDDLHTYIDTLSGHGPQHEAIVDVDLEDDLTSVRTKLETMSVPRAVLVIPRNAKTLREGLEFRLLRRLQRELGLDLIIVSNDLNRRGFAAENGFRNVFGSLKEYYRARRYAPNEPEGAPFTVPEEFSPFLSIGKWGLAVGALLTSVLLAIAALLVPSATVVVYPETQTLSRNVDVLVEIGGPRVDVTAQRLAGRIVQERVQVQDSVNVKDVQPPAPPPPPDSPPGGLQPGVNITLEVRDALRDRMVQAATTQSVERLRAQLKGNESLPDGSIRTEVTAEKYDHNIGDQADTLGGTLEVVSSGIVFNNDDFNRLVLTLWSQDIPRSYRALGDPALTPPAVVSAEGQHLTLRTRATGRLQQALDAGAIAAAVRGRTVSEAQQAIEKEGQFTQPAEITLWPDWIGRAFRVHVREAVDPSPPAN